MCGGVTVDPGDWVFGDQDGIIVGTQAEFEQALPTAEAIVQLEEMAVEEVRSSEAGAIRATLIY